MFFFPSFQKRIFVQDIEKDSLADKDGKLQIGDQIVSINGHDVKKSKFMEANRFLRSSKDKVRKNG